MNSLEKSMDENELADKVLMRIEVTSSGDPSVGIFPQDAYIIDSNDQALLDYSCLAPQDIEPLREDLIDAVMDLFGILWGEKVNVKLIEE